MLIIKLWKRGMTTNKVLLIIMSLVSAVACTTVQTIDIAETNPVYQIPVTSIISAYNNMQRLYGLSTKYYQKNTELDICYFKWTEPIEQLSDEYILRQNAILGYSVCVLSDTITQSYVIYDGYDGFDIYDYEHNLITNVALTIDDKISANLILGRFGVELSTVNMMISGMIFDDKYDNTNCMFDSIHIINRQITGVVVCTEFTNSLVNDNIDVIVDIKPNYHFDIIDISDSSILSSW